MKAKQQGRCETCHFWESVNDGSVGFCHRYPPTGKNNLLSNVAETLAVWWCGEWAKAELPVVSPVQCSAISPGGCRCMYDEGHGGEHWSKGQDVMWGGGA